MNLQKNAVAAIALGLWAAAGLAAPGLAGPPGPPDPPDFEVEPIIVTASRVSEPLSDSGDSVTVIDEAEIRVRERMTVADVLRGTAGVSIQRSGTLGRTTSVRLRGANTGQTLVLIDGVRVNDPTIGGFDFMDLTLDNIQRIEIVRGPQSSLYGADAVGGVIQVFTRKGRGKPSFEASTEYGSYETGRGIVSGQGGWDRGSFSASLGRAWTDGRFVNDNWDDTTVSAAGNITLSKTADLSASYRRAAADRGVPIEVFFGRQDFDENSTEQDHYALGSVALNHAPRSWWRHTIRFSHNRTHRLFDDPLDADETPVSVFEFASDTNARLTSLDWQHDFTPRDGRHGRGVMGAEVRRESGRSLDPKTGAVAFDESYGVKSFYAHGQARTREGLLLHDDQLVLNAGFRLDGYDRYGRQVTPKLSTVYRLPGPGIKLHASYGKGFKAPSISDFALPYWGNPDIRPERSRSFEAGIAKSLEPSSTDVSLVYFDNRFSDLIAADPVLYIASNIASARTRGVEVEVRSRPAEKLWLTASYTYLDSEDLATSLELLRRPRHQAAFSAAVRPVPELQLHFETAVRGDMRDFDVAGFPSPNQGYVTFDVAASYGLRRWGNRVSLYGRLENMSDEDYMEVTGYPSPGRNVHGGFRLTL